MARFEEVLACHGDVVVVIGALVAYIFERQNLMVRVPKSQKLKAKVERL